MKQRSTSLVLATLTVVLILLSASAAAAQEGGPSADGAASPIDTGLSSPDGGGGPGPITAGFSYQGQLKSGTAPVNGACDFQFSLWDQSGTGTPPSGGIQIGTTEIQTGVSVSKGLFTVILNFTNQFGDTAFQAARWLQIAVRCPAGSGSYTTLSPRQPLWAAPYAQGLRAGTMIRGSAYQTLKVQSDAATGSIPAVVTGEMMSALDGVGVYGSSNSDATGSAGAGVWGRTWNKNGAGVKGTGVNGSVGVLGESTGASGVHGISGATGLCGGMTSLCAGVEGEGQGATSGVAGVSATGAGLHGESQIGPALWLQTTSGGDLVRGYEFIGGNLRFRVTHMGDVYADGTYTSPASDFAEMLPATAGLEPGDVLAIGAKGRLERSAAPYQTSVAGIYSTQPGFLGGSAEDGQTADRVPLAIIGIVPVKVVAENGPIHTGDLLTTSSTPGHAMKASPRVVDGVSLYPTGTIIGKALGALESGTGAIRMLVTLQ